MSVYVSLLLNIVRSIVSFDYGIMPLLCVKAFGKQFISCTSRSAYLYGLATKLIEINKLQSRWIHIIKVCLSLQMRSRLYFLKACVAMAKTSRALNYIVG